MLTNTVIGNDKTIRILDYGCGGGQLITYLRVLGYKNVAGVDVGNIEKINKLNSMFNNLGFGPDVFFIYDGDTLPFNESSFDTIISQQVVEHVHNIDKYFSESKRVLSPKGKMLIDFPHRLVPFDTHTRMWFVHYFPIKIRNYIYNKYRGNRAKFYKELLNLKTLWFYLRLFRKLDLVVVNMTVDRIMNFTYKKNYEGNIVLRTAVNNLFKTPIVGVYIRKLLSIFGSFLNCVGNP